MTGISGHGADGQIPSGAALLSRHECTLSQVSTRTDVTLDVAGV